MAKEIKVTAEQIEALVAFAEKQEAKAEEYYDACRDEAAARRDGIAMGIYHALRAIGAEID